jgi:hypothetical protein
MGIYATCDCLTLTNFSICLIHPFANSSSVNLFADCRALRRIANLSSFANAISKASANSVAVVAWYPICCQLLVETSDTIRDVSPVGKPS